jgi:hypothetical protein
VNAFEVLGHDATRGAHQDLVYSRLSLNAPLEHVARLVPLIKDLSASNEKVLELISYLLKQGHVCGPVSDALGLAKLFEKQPEKLGRAHLSHEVILVKRLNNIVRQLLNYVENRGPEKSIAVML